VPHTKEEIKAMLEAVGLRNVDELFRRHTHRGTAQKTSPS